MKLQRQRAIWSLARCRKSNSEEPPKIRTPTMTDAEANEILQRLHVGSLRSTFAQALFPYDPTKYPSRGQWAKAVGTRVAADIHNNPSLRIAMQEAGYKAGEKGYTHQQQMVLIKFFKKR